MRKPSTILVAYASGFGTTAEVAQTIAEEMSVEGTVVDARPIADVRGLDRYDAVIIGSAIRYDKWLPEATAFVSSNQVALAKRPVAFFFTCLALSVEGEKSKRQGQVYADRLSTLFPLVEPAGIGRFAGVLDYSKIPLLPRLAAKFVFAFLGVKEGDHRNWPAIRSWANSTNIQLSN